MILPHIDSSENNQYPKVHQLQWQRSILYQVSFSVTSHQMMLRHQKIMEHYLHHPVIAKIGFHK